MYRLNVSIPPPIEAALRQEAKDSGLMMSEIIRQALWDRYSSPPQSWVNAILTTAEMEDKKEKENVN